MKRALSLIIVLAMVLCMIPFSAFAADYELAEDFVSGVITLVGGEAQTFLYTASEEGTLYITAEAVTPVDENGEPIEGASVPEPYIEVDGVEYTDAGVAVTAGKSVAITISDEAMVGGDVTVSTNLIGLPGTESNPYDYYNPTSGMAPADQAATTVSVEPGASVYYNLWYYAGTTLKISGVGVKAVKVWEDNTIDGTDVGYVEFEISAMERVVLIKITNKDAAAQTYTFEGIVPEGTMNNPEVVTVGEYKEELAEGNQGYFYKYIAEGNGTVSIGVAANGTISETDSEGVTTERAIGWQYTIDPFNGGTAYSSDDAEVVNPATVEVSTGDEIIFVVGTYDSKVYGPAGTVTTTIAFEAAAEESGPIVIESLPYEATHSGEHEQVYSYTATEEGYLFVTSSDGNDGGFVNFNVWMGVEVYNGGWIYKMAADETVEVTVNTPSWGNVEADYTYNFSWMTEVEPDGSSAFPFVIDTILPDGVTLTNDGEDAVYYSYVAEKNGEIYNSFWESASAIAEGETMNIYVPAGQSVTVYYLPPVALIGEAEYTTIDAAVAAAVSGDTITLVANATAEAGIVLPAGANLDLSTFDLVAPYLVAFTGSVVTGDVAEASITASNLVADNVTISDVEYTWTATDGVYTLTAVGAVAKEVAKIGDTPYATVEDALNAAKSGDTVVMSDHSDESAATLVIKGGVTLNLSKYELKAAYVIGLTGSIVTGDRLSSSKDYAKLYVDSGNISISNDTVYTQTAANGVDYHLITVKMGEYYVFTHTQLYDSEAESTGYGFTSDKDAGTAKLTFYFNLPGVAKTPIANDGASVHGVSFIVEATWVTPTDNGDMYQSMTFTCSEELAKALASGNKLSCTVEDCNSYKDLKIAAKLLTDTGAVVRGVEYTY